MTETGDIKYNLPIIDQSNLWERLQTAFDSGSGSVRVMVIDDEDQEIGVDMKVLHGSRLDGEIPAAKRKTQEYQILLSAVRTNDISKVEDVLKNGADINWRDSDRRTALFDAIESQHNDMVDLLIRRGIQLEASDKNGKTVLDIAVSDPKLYLGAFRLLEKGALPTSNLRNGISELLLAAAEGDTEQTKRLLADSVEPSSRDRLGYTALHEAACFGQYEIADLLIQHGADVNAEITHGGATVLHAAVQRGREHRQFLKIRRGITPRLSESHLKVVALLLQNRVNTEHRRSYDNLTVRELVSEELKLPENCQPTQRRLLQRILILLSNPLCEEENIGRASRPQLPGVDGATDLRDLSNSFSLQIQYYTSNRNSEKLLAPVSGFIDKKAREDYWKEQIQQLETWAKGPKEDSSEPRDYWRWVHLPANNVGRASHGMLYRGNQHANMI